MSKNSPLILLTNDDGIHAEGIRHLRIAAEKFGEVCLVAPETEQSAVGHSITLYDPIKAHEISRDGAFYGYGISGTPADSVKLALQAILPRRPDLVISGINNGANVGINVLYSGTVSAATEAAMMGIPAMAVSVAQKKFPPFQWALTHVEKLTRWLLRFGLPQGVALNVNIPALPPEKTLGYKLTRQCLSKSKESFEQREDPRGNTYYWLSGEIPTEESDEQVDAVALVSGYVSITPLFYDLTAHSCNDKLTSLLTKL